MNAFSLKRPASKNIDSIQERLFSTKTIFPRKVWRGAKTRLRLSASRTSWGRRPPTSASGSGFEAGPTGSGGRTAGCWAKCGSTWSRWTLDRSQFRQTFFFARQKNYNRSKFVILHFDELQLRNLFNFFFHRQCQINNVRPPITLSRKIVMWLLL